jgi:uncharacterized protein HemX
MNKIQALITSFLLPLALGMVPVFIWWLRKREAEKKKQLEQETANAKNKIDEFESVFEANRTLRHDLEDEIKRLRGLIVEKQKEINSNYEEIRGLRKQLEEKERELKILKQKYGE